MPPVSQQSWTSEQAPCGGRILGRGVSKVRTYNLLSPCTWSEPNLLIVSHALVMSKTEDCALPIHGSPIATPPIPYFPLCIPPANTAHPSSSSAEELEESISPPHSAYLLPSLKSEESWSTSIKSESTLRRVERARETVLSSRLVPFGRSFIHGAYHSIAKQAVYLSRSLTSSFSP